MVFRCRLANPDTREATAVFETGRPGNVTRRETTVRFLCEERTPPWKRRALQRAAIIKSSQIKFDLLHVVVQQLEARLWSWLGTRLRG